jgi:hypothetical protein
LDRQLSQAYDARRRPDPEASHSSRGSTRFDDAEARRDERERDRRRREDEQRREEARRDRGRFFDVRRRK